MTFLQTLPIKRRLQAVTLMTCASALAMAFTAMFWFQSVQFRKGFAEELESLAAVIAHNSSATLAFDDKKSAAEVLAALKVKPHFNCALIYGADGKLFARYGEENFSSQAAGVLAGDGVRFNDGYARLSVPIQVQDAPPGRLQLQARYQDKYRELVGLYATVLSVVVVSSLLIVVLLSSVLQRVISVPIIKLANVAAAITDKEDYSTRAPEGGRDEVGLLTRAFNRMLDLIEVRNVVLRESEERFRQLAENISEVFWMTDVAKNHMAYISPAYEAIWGRSCESLRASPRQWMEAIHADDRERIGKAAETKQAAGEYDEQYRILRPDGSVRWIHDRAFPIRDAEGRVYRVVGIAEDISAQKKAQAELNELHRQFATASRQAGMAEVATSVLHNVGNVLNSVSVSATLVGDQLRQSRVPGLRRATTLLREKNGDLADYLTTDPTGKLVPEYLGVVADQLAAEREQMISEMDSVGRHIEHIKEIVAMQQNYARVSGAFENLSAAELVEDALRMNAAAFDRHRVEIVREIDRKTPAIHADRHKVLQILINLIRNAKYAMDAQDPHEKRMVVRVGPVGEDRVKIAVSDNGVGITAENLARIFTHGFTTKKDGHGFGLHSGANAAKEMGGSLTVFSAGPGAGASFILELPVAETRKPSNQLKQQ